MGPPVEVGVEVELVEAMVAAAVVLPVAVVGKGGIAPESGVYIVLS